MGPKTYAPTGALPPASARVRAPGPKTGPIGTADTGPRTALAPPTKTALAPPTKTAPTAPPPPTRTAHYNNTVTLNYKLTKDVADLKQELKKQQEEHDQRLVDLYAQIADVNKKLETTTTEKNNIHEHYQRWKRTWTTQIADQDRTIQDQKRQLDAMATTLEVMAKRQRT